LAIPVETKRLPILAINGVEIVQKKGDVDSGDEDVAVFKM